MTYNNSYIGVVKVLVKDRIKHTRKVLGLTQKKFSDRIVTALSLIAQIEAGSKEATARTIRLITLEFGVDEHWLKTGEGKMFNEDLNASVSKMISYFKALSSPLQECALEQVNILSNLEDALKS